MHLPSCGFCRSDGPQCENKRKQKDKKYLDFAKELEKMWSMKSTVIPFVVGALGMIPKNLENGLED